MEARGTFEVKMSPLPAPAEGLAGMALDKVYTGELEATGHGQMLSAGNPKSGNAGYVAIERVTGKLVGRTGSFALMQSGTMTTGVEPKLTVTIVPGSGTGDLSGISGGMSVLIAGAEHNYVLSYAFSQ